MSHHIPPIYGKFESHCLTAWHFILTHGCTCGAGSNKRIHMRVIFANFDILNIKKSMWPVYF